MSEESKFNTLINNYLNEYIQNNLKNKNNNQKEGESSYFNQISQIIKNSQKETIQTFFTTLNTILNDYLNKNNQTVYKESALTILQKITSLSKFSPEIFDIIYNIILPCFEDITIVPNVIELLYSLFKTYSNERENKLIPLILNKFKGEVLNIPAYSQSTRHFALLIILELLKEKEYFNNNDKNQTELINIIIDCIDEEKDPRNLLLTFQIVKELIFFISNTNLIKTYSKNLYEIISGYYPINFEPPKNIKNPITAKELSDKLNEAISLEIFAEYFFDDINNYDINSVGDILNTLQIISKNYSKNLLNKYYENIFNFIFTNIINNNDEIIHIECLVTLKIFFKNFLIENNNNNNTNFNNDFNNLIDKLFYEKNNIKEAFDAKDILCIIIEYDNENKFIINIINAIIKLISLFLFNNKNLHFLKISNSLLFFILKKENIQENIENEMIEILKKNKNMFLSLINNINNENNENNENNNNNDNINYFSNVINILSALCLKIKENKKLFEIDEIKEIYNKIKNIYYNINYINNENNNKNFEQISFCLNEFSKKLNINLFKEIENEYYKNNKFINNKIYFLIKLFLKEINNNNNENIINFIFNNIENNSIQNILKEYLNNINNNKINKENIIYLNKYKNLFENIIINHMNDNNYFDLIYIILSSNLNINYNKIIQLILKNNLSLNSLKFLKISITKLNSNEIKENEELFYTFQSYYLENNNNLEINEIQKQLLKCIKKILDKFNTNNESIKNYIKNNINKNLDQIYSNQLKINEFQLKENLYSIFINFLIKNCNKNEIEEIKKLIEIIINKISLSNNEYSNIFESSKLFKIKNINEDILDFILLKLKSFYKQRKFINLILNIYYNNKNNDNLDIILLLNVECILQKINIKKTLLIFKKLLIDNKNSNKFNNNISCDYFQIINIIIDYLKENNNKLDSNFKIECLKLIGIIKDFMSQENLENFEKVLIITSSLKKFLNDKKRKVRKICGIVINIWTFL